MPARCLLDRVNWVLRDAVCRHSWSVIVRWTAMSLSAYSRVVLAVTSVSSVEVINLVLTAPPDDDEFCQTSTSPLQTHRQPPPNWVSFRVAAPLVWNITVNYICTHFMASSYNFRFWSFLRFMCLQRLNFLFYYGKG